LSDELGLESEHWRPPWGQTILKQDGVDKSSSQSKFSSSGDATRDEPPQLEKLRRKNEEELNALREENQQMRAQIEQNPHKGRNPVAMKMEGTVPDETSPEYKPPPTK